MVEVKEGLEPQPENITVASIAHPSYFLQYKIVLGLTGTIGDMEERKEIQQVYHVDTFDVPPHRPCKRVRWPTQILESEDSLHLFVIKRIEEETIQKRRPVLILFKTISECKRFSEKLTKQRIDFNMITDIQVEDEDYLVLKAGEEGAVTIATNTAGRGTDITPEPDAIKNGGLHTIFAFFPTNLRVECQGLGRSGRQGNPGTCEILIAPENTPLLAKLSCFPFVMQLPTVSILYEFRKLSVRQVSEARTLRCQQEVQRFRALRLFFEDRKRVQDAVQTPAFAQAVLEYTNGKGNISHVQQFASLVLAGVTQLWAEYFTDVVSENDEGDSTCIADGESLYRPFAEQLARFLSNPQRLLETMKYA